MNSESEIKEISFDIYGEFITQIAREWFYTGEKSHEKVIEILMNSMTGTDTPEAQIRRYAEDILLGRAALKGSTAAGTYHLETYEPGGDGSRKGALRAAGREGRRGCAVQSGCVLCRAELADDAPIGLSL